MRNRWIVAVLAIIGCWLVVGLGLDGESPARLPGADATSLEVTRSPAFEVEVIKPRMARPVFGLLPSVLETKLSGHGNLGFDHNSPGAGVDHVGVNRLALKDDGWDLLFEIDGSGRVGPTTRLVFPMLLAEKQRTLHCRPDHRAFGDLHIGSAPGADHIEGRFLVRLAICENAATGRVIEWPPAPLIVQGRFDGLPLGGWTPTDGE